MGRIHMKELNIFGSCRSLKVFVPCLELMARGLLNTESLVDLVVHMGGYQGALEMLKFRKEDMFKVAFMPGKK